MENVINYAYSAMYQKKSDVTYIEKIMVTVSTLMIFAVILVYSVSQFL